MIPADPKYCTRACIHMGKPAFYSIRREFNPMEHPGIIWIPRGRQESWADQKALSV